MFEVQSHENKYFVSNFQSQIKTTELLNLTGCPELTVISD